MPKPTKQIAIRMDEIDQAMLAHIGDAYRLAAKATGIGAKVNPSIIVRHLISVEFLGLRERGLVPLDPADAEAIHTDVAEGASDDA